jgi:hypothetical protein
MLGQPFREGLERRDVLAGRQHLRHEEEANRTGQHERGNTGKEVSIALSLGELTSVDFSREPVDGDGDCYSQ